MKKVLFIFLVFSFSAFALTPLPDLDKSDKSEIVTDIGVFTADIINVANVSTNVVQKNVKSGTSKITKKVSKLEMIFTTAQTENSYLDNIFDVGWCINNDSINKYNYVPPFYYLFVNYLTNTTNSKVEESRVCGEPGCYLDHFEHPKEDLPDEDTDDGDGGE